MTDTADLTEERVRLPADGFTLSGELAYAHDQPRFGAVVFGPHPYMGGSMNNSLVMAVHRRLARAGAVALRFDYPGIGDSQGPAIDVAAAMAAFWKTGHAPQDPLMVSAGAAAMDWLRSQIETPLVAVGYSFGAYVAAAHPREVAAQVLISPTLARHAFPPAGPKVPRCIIYADNDFATPVERTLHWIETQPLRPHAHCISGGDHFFRGREEQVAGCITQFLASSPALAAEVSCTTA